MSWPHVLAARDTAPAGLTPAARHLWVVVATYANDAGRAWPALETLAAATGYHPSSIRRLVDQLELSTDAGVIHRKGRTHLFDLAPYARGTPRPLRATPAPRARRTLYEPAIEPAAARGETVDIYARLPNWTTERLEREITQLRLEVDP